MKWKEHHVLRYMCMAIEVGTQSFVLACDNRTKRVDRWSMKVSTVKCVTGFFKLNSCKSAEELEASFSLIKRDDHIKYSWLFRQNMLKNTPISYYFHKISHK